MRILDYKDIVITNSESAVSLEYNTVGWSERFFCIENRKAYSLGYPCGTCNFIFERLDGATKKISPFKIIDVLSSEKINLTHEAFSEIVSIIPNGKYIALLLEINPNKIIVGSKSDYFVSTEPIDPFWGFSHHPKVNYYMDTDIKINNEETFHTFILPIVPEHWLDKPTVDRYKSKIEDGACPTAISLSYLDILERDEGLQSCFVNILLDGHHKINAASTLRNRRPINMISFLSTEMGVSTEKYIYERLNCISAGQYSSLRNDI